MKLYSTPSRPVPWAVAVFALGCLPSARAFVGPCPVLNLMPKLTNTGKSSIVATFHQKRTRSQLSPSLLPEVVSQYQLLLNECPVATQCVTSSILAGLGDVLAQFQQVRHVKLDRLVKFMIKGFGGGIIWALWFAINEQWTTQVVDMMWSGTSIMAASGPVIVAKMVVSILLEQFIAVPIIYTFWDIPLPILLSSTRDNRSIPMQLQKTLPGLLWDNAKVWTFANILVYTAPLEYRVLVSSLVDVAWQSIVSSHVMTSDAEIAPATTLTQQENVLLETILPQQSQRELAPTFMAKDRQPQTADVLP
jgi:Mpv17 / PMP22 family